jgi:hypothetical protein
MKVVHIESGLGNQMLSYCELLALKKIHPEEQIYLETIVYDYKEANDMICQWNGYELDKIFGVRDTNIRELFDEKQWKKIHDSIYVSRFWEHSWNWPVYFCKAFEEQGLVLNNLRGDFEEKDRQFANTFKGRLRENCFYKMFQKTWLYANIRTWISQNKVYTSSDTDYLFYAGEEDVLTGQKLSFMYRNNQIERIDKEIREVFRFPNFEDENNIHFLDQISGKQSVAIHARRGDLLSLNGRYYKGGYFKRAVNLIKRNVQHPVFCFFCDSGSVEWCKENGKIFGLNYKKDDVLFVDWNKGSQSYRDMQLMSLCQHNIITISSFGWWGAYLNQNPGKITISPEIGINTTHHI